MQPRSTERTLKTTELSLRLVELVVELDGATPPELIERTGSAKSTVHNHLTTLSQYGYLVREDDTYQLGAKLVHMGDYARKRRDVYPTAERLVAELADETGLDVDFTVEENGRIVSLYDELSYSDTASFLNEGRLFHVHSTACGKAMLAKYPEERVHEIVDQWGLPAVTDETITDVDTLLEELETVRERGYGASYEEGIEGLWAVSMVVTDDADRVHGSFNVSGPTYLHSEERIETVLEALEAKVEALEAELASS